MIYFVQVGDDGPIKIGIAEDVKKRISKLQVAHFIELKLRLTIDGDERHESYLHEKFSLHRIRGEWFHPVSQLLEFIKSPEPLPEFSSRVIQWRDPARMRNAVPKFSKWLFEQHMTATAFARLIDVDPETVRLWLRGKSRPANPQYDAILAATLGQVTPNDFLPSSDVPSQDTGQPNGGAG